MEIMARYGEAADVAWKMGRIMLKYRPIAPKPVTGSGSVGPTDSKIGNGRGKRKGSIKEHGKRGRKSAKKISTINFSNNDNNNSLSCAPVVTLPLMPMTPERKDQSSPAADTQSPTASEGHVAGVNWTAWQQGMLGSNVVVAAPRPVRPVESGVTVECVTDMWRYGEAPAGLETDTCPVFLSDDCDRVTWTNAAYKHMVVGPSEGEEEVEEMGVALMTRGLVPREGVTCFTCRVRVRCTCKGRGKVSVAAPCDVWRLADGRLAWRLDVKAALSLGLGC